LKILDKPNDRSGQIMTLLHDTNKPAYFGSFRVRIGHHDPRTLKSTRVAAESASLDYYMNYQGVNTGDGRQTTDLVHHVGGDVPDSHRGSGLKDSH